MTKENFETMMESLEARKALCMTYLGGIHTTDDLSAITLAKAANLKNFCIAEEAIMTNIAMVDLYHVIGMGKLSSVQMMKFTYSMQEYLSYRPVIKAIVKHFDSIMSLPKIPVKTQYKLKGLGGFTLTAGEGTLVDDDCVEVAVTNTTLPFSISGHTITVDMNQFEHFVVVMAAIINTKLSSSNFKQKLTSFKEYAGIQWTELNGSEAIGTIKSNDIYSRIVSYYNKHAMDS